MDPYLGEIRAVGFNFAPVGWSMCQGQLLPIRSYSALFALLGTYYGGDGSTTFALPNLQGRVPLAFGTGPGLGTYNIGQSGGSSTHTLTISELPSHSHSVIADAAVATSEVPTNNLLGRAAARAGRYYGPSSPVVQLGINTVGPGGGNGDPHNNQQPYLTLNFIIATTTGIFPPRQ